MLGLKLSKSNKVDWGTVAVFKTVKDAFSTSEPPFIVEGTLSRCGNYAAANYSGLVMVLENDMFPVLYYPPGGINPFQSLTNVGDFVSLRFTKDDLNNPFRFSEGGAVRADKFKNITVRKAIKQVNGIETFTEE
jgi:hypothetical protein